MTPEQNARLAALMLDNLHGITNALRVFAERMESNATVAASERAHPYVSAFMDQAKEARTLANKIDRIAEGD